MMMNKRDILAPGQFFGEQVRTAITESFQFTEIDAFSSSSKVPRHTHASSHFLFLVEGTYLTEARNNAGEIYGRATLIFNPTGTTHCDRFQSQYGRFLTITLNADIAQRLDAEIPVSLIIKDRPALDSVLRLRSSLLDGPVTGVTLESMGLELAAQLLPPVERETRHTPSWLLNARQLLHERCSTDIRIGDAAAQIGVHPVHLARAFRRYFFIGPGEFLRRCRISKARGLLLGSALSIAEIAMEVGFSDQSHFANAFKRETGLTPAQYRQLNPPAHTNRSRTLHTRNIS